MEVRSIHTRYLAASPAKVGEVLDSLGGDADLLWPAERWPADMRVRFDRPLGRGARGGHGPIRYSVEDYEPGRRLEFRFDGGSLAGGHCFVIDGIGPDEATLTHTLQGRLDGLAALSWPILRRVHDAYVEDILDRAELAATGRAAGTARQPWWLRASNALARRADRRADRRSVHQSRWTPSARLVRLSGVAVPAVLAVTAVIHAAWAYGWRWPGGSDSALAERVVGPDAALPSAAMTWAVAALILVAGMLVRAAAVGTSAIARVGAWGVGAVLFLRGALYIPVDLAGGMDDIYERLDLAIYSPLCLLLGAGAMVVAGAARDRARAAVRARRPVRQVASRSRAMAGE